MKQQWSFAPEVQEYIDSTADARRDLLLKLHQLVRDVDPEVSARISFRIIHYETPTGWLYLGYWKQGVSLHVGYLDALEGFRAKHPKIKTGRGCVNLKLKDDVPWDALRELIRAALASREH